MFELILCYKRGIVYLHGDFVNNIVAGPYFVLIQWCVPSQICCSRDQFFGTNMYTNPTWELPPRETVFSIFLNLKTSFTKDA